MEIFQPVHNEDGSWNLPGANEVVILINDKTKTHKLGYYREDEESFCWDEGSWCWYDADVMTRSASGKAVLQFNGNDDWEVTHWLPLDMTVVLKHDTPDIRVLLQELIEYKGGSEKYGFNYEDDVILIHQYCWCDKDECPWCSLGNMTTELEELLGSEYMPNFWYKPDNYALWWYKYIGRGMESNIPLTEEIYNNISEYIKTLKALWKHLAIWQKSK